MAGAVVLWSSATFAQGAGNFSPGSLAWHDGGCALCHGGVATGGGVGEAPPGPDLWRSRLDRAQLKETIACGRLTTMMPYHVIDAYTKRACWGRPLGDPPEGVSGAAEMTEAQIELLTDFLMDNVLGKGPVNRAKCGLFFGNDPNHVACMSYPN